MKNELRLAAGVAAFVMCVSLPAAGQATRTWVSGVGDDANPCSRTAPCKTFAGAISKTASGGIINVMDPGGFGAVTITKPITIEGNGTLGSILHSSTNGIVINITTGTNRNVTLRDILIDGSGATLGINGIRFLAGDSLLVENCSIMRQSGAGISFEPNSTALLTVRNSSISQGTTNGILVKPQIGGFARATIADSLITRNGNGIRAEDNTNVVVTGSTIANNTGVGLWGFSAGASLSIFSDRNVVSHNGSSGLQTNGGNAAMRVSDTTIVNNLGTGVSVVGGQIATYGNNRNVNNGAPGAFNAVLSEQ